MGAISGKYSIWTYRSPKRMMNLPIILDSYSRSHNNEVRRQYFLTLARKYAELRIKFDEEDSAPSNCNLNGLDDFRFIAASD